MSAVSPLPAPNQVSARDRLTAARVLVVERRPAISRLLRTRTGGPRDVVWAGTAGTALTEVASRPPQVVLLDLDLPDLDGVQLCRLLRARHPGLPIMMVTDRSRPVEPLLGRESAADDYLVRPVTATELLARLRTRLRRGAGDDPGAGRLVRGGLVIDLAPRRVLLAEREVPLRRKEFELLARLARSAGRAVPRKTLMADVWDANWFGSTKTLDVTMATLRRKLDAVAEATGTPAPTITTIRGHGYRFERPA